MKSTANDVFMKIVLLNKSFHLFGSCNHSTYHTEKEAKQKHFYCISLISMNQHSWFIQQEILPGSSHKLIKLDFDEKSLNAHSYVACTVRTLFSSSSFLVIFRSLVSKRPVTSDFVCIHEMFGRNFRFLMRSHCFWLIAPSLLNILQF